MGAYFNWTVGNAILPATDPDPSHEGIQKVDRTTVPELAELPATALQVQLSVDNAEGHFTPLGLPGASLAFDINPNQITGSDPKPHFEQIFERAKGSCFPPAVVLSWISAAGARIGAASLTVHATD